MHCKPDPVALLQLPRWYAVESHCELGHGLHTPFAQGFAPSRYSDFLVQAGCGMHIHVDILPAHTPVRYCPTGQFSFGHFTHLPGCQHHSMPRRCVRAHNPSWHSNEGRWLQQNGLKRRIPLHKTQRHERVCVRACVCACE